MGIISTVTDWVTTPYTIYLVLKDPAVSRGVKIRAAIGLAVIFTYVVSPIDLIPDVIPFAGWLDDIVVVPLGFALLRIITPGIDIVEKRARAESSVKRILRWTIFSLIVVFLLGLFWISLLIYVIVRLITK
jgi:uncharacterized membrane protein YkvA (DUF1232 family)